jgi:Recombinase zinc beta ribbon domain/Transposase, Mutator family
MLTNPYYKGDVTYRGVTYSGAHEPIVPVEVWYRVQTVLTAHNSAGDRRRRHDHYLKGTVYCGACGSRLMISNARSASDNIYPYFVCAGRPARRTDCTRPAMLVDKVEQLVADHYKTIQIPPDIRKAMLLGEGMERWRCSRRSSTNAIESLNARYRRAVRARGHFPTELAALKCLYLVTRSLDPTGRGRARWAVRWKPTLNAFAFPDRYGPCADPLTGTDRLGLRPTTGSERAYGRRSCSAIAVSCSRWAMNSPESIVPGAWRPPGPGRRSTSSAFTDSPQAGQHTVGVKTSPQLRWR